MSLGIDIPGRGNSSFEGSEAGMHMVCIRNSEKASVAAAEGGSCSVGHCTGNTSEDQIMKASRPW